MTMYKQFFVMFCPLEVLHHNKVMFLLIELCMHVFMYVCMYEREI